MKKEEIINKLTKLLPAFKRWKFEAMTKQELSALYENTLNIMSRPKMSRKSFHKVKTWKDLPVLNDVGYEVI